MLALLLVGVYQSVAVVVPRSGEQNKNINPTKPLDFSVSHTLSVRVRVHVITKGVIDVAHSVCRAFYCCVFCYSDGVVFFSCSLTYLIKMKIASTTY